MASDKSRLLIFGATGYLGRFMVKVSVSMGHPTFAYARPIKPNADPEKLLVHQEFRAMGVTIFQGELDEHEKLVSAIKHADIVISVLAIPQHVDQFNIINAIKDAGNVKRFLPSEFGNEIDRVTALPPFQRVLDTKKKIRREIEAAGICFTYVSANSLSDYFIDYLLHPHDNCNELTVYGTGEAKAVLNYEEDVAFYTIKAAVDPRTANRLVICKPPLNVVSQLDLISSWQKKTGRNFNRNHIPEDEMIKLSEILPHPQNIPVGILHNIFVKGDQTSFELRKDDLEASALYPDYKYKSVDDLLNICVASPPKPKQTAFV